MIADKVRERLQSAQIAWLTTVRADGQPQASPVWFLLDGETILIYSQPGKAKLSSIASNPKVCLNLDSDGVGGNITVLEGVAALDPSTPPADQVAPYVEKYSAGIKHLGWTPASFAGDYRVAVRIEVGKVRSW